jgi:hypothetical protein
MPVDLTESVRHKTILEKATRTADQTDAPVLDTHDFEGQALVVHVDSHTDGTHDFELEVSDDGTTFRSPDPVQADDLPTVDGSDDTGDYYAAYLGSARYVRPVVTVSGSPSTGATYSVHGVVGEPSSSPIE